MQCSFKYSFLILAALLALPKIASGQKAYGRDLIGQIRERCEHFDGKIGVGVLGLNFQDRQLYNDTAFPMQSVYKFPLAIYTLSQVDGGRLRLDQPVPIVRTKLEQNTWSPMLSDFKKDTFSLTLSQLLLYSVSKSDNNACDILFKLAGGTKPVHEYFVDLGISQMAIGATEAEMHANWNTQYTNWDYNDGLFLVTNIKPA